MEWKTACLPAFVGSLLLLSAAAACADSPPTPLPGTSSSNVADRIKLEDCYMDLIRDDDGVPSLSIGVRYANTSDTVLTAAKFEFQQFDAFHVKLGTPDDEVIEGTLAPGKSAFPQRTLFGNHLLTRPEFPSSPAWDVYTYKDVASIHCTLISTLFADGSIWSRQ